MLFRALLLALCCCWGAATLTPLSAVGDDNDCALYLAGPGRTSAFDYSLNLLRGNIGYEGQHTCITYDAVNQAYLEARKRILVSQPKGDWKPEDYASVGELILDISINLARTYGLTYEEIEKGLPLIDTSRTLIREVCPPVFSHVECRPGKYRRIDGLCNNLEHPTWGSTNAPFQRLIGPLFSDGINAPRISHTGRDLPLSRVVSRTMHPDEGFHDHAGTVMVIAWGQFMDHDYTLTGTPLDPINRNDPEECCKRPPHLKHPYCNEIRIPDDDYFYRLFGVKCIDFVRGFPSPRPGCRLGSRVPFNTLTGSIDGNTVYGVTEKFARKLRTGYGGLLRMNPVFKDYGLKDLLPLKLDVPDEGCTRPNKHMYCFEAGEIRVNEQLVLTVMHTLMAREHNRVAEGLAAVNPHWDDETLYQEARRINIAEIQHITYNEFLPILLGKDVMEKFGLVLEKEGYWDGYDATVNPDVIDAFASAAYRFGHSLLPTAVERWSKAHKFIASKRLSDLIRRPYDLYRAGVLDEYVMGLMNQVAQAMDDSITQEVTNHLFKKVGARFGMDLVSFNMQRGREFGIPGYMEFRKFCGLSGANTFQDLHGSMPNETVRKYESIFEHPVDVDLWSGGVSERPLPGSMLGPTFACIIATQFSYSRRGDRFWYELPNQPSSFTPEQLAEIRKSRLARVICDNTDIIDTVQLYPMVLPDHELNPRVPCRSGIIPSMDFSKWAEPAPFAGAAKEFITEALIFAYNATDTCDETVASVEVMPTIIDNNCEDHSHSKSDKNHGCIFNETEEVSRVAQVDQQTLCNDENPKINIKTNIDVVTNNTTQDCNEVNVNEVAGTDTVLKYVYKKKDNITTIPEKMKGHFKNALKRRKRSYNRDNHVIKNGHNYLDYTPNKDVESIIPLHLQNAPNVVRADFNIETIHDTVPLNKHITPENIQRSNDEIHDTVPLNKHITPEDIQRSNDEIHDTVPLNKHITPENIQRSNDEEDFQRTENIQRSNDEEDFQRTENIQRSNDEGRRKSHIPANVEIIPRDDSFSEHKRKEVVRQDSNESGEKYSAEDKSEDSNNHRDNKKKYVEKSSEEYVNDSNESRHYNNDKEIPYEKQSEEKLHSNERNNEHLTDKSKDDINSYDEDHISESKSNENSQEKNYDNNSGEKKASIKESSPLNIQEVDLDDFSHERIQLNNKGEVESAKDHANFETDSSHEIIPIVKPNRILNESEEKQSQSLEAADVPSLEINQQQLPVNINDGEIKPVVEVINEGDRGDSSDEGVVNLSDEDTSIETDTKEIYSNEKNDKSIAQNNKDDNVKQEFERIPLNYNHNKKEHQKNHEKASDKTLPISNKPENRDEGENDGTVDSLSKEGFDENLKIKFEDVSVKLPEIKLPDDILSYDYEEPAYLKGNKYNRKHYNYDDEDEYHNERIQKKKNDDKNQSDDYNDDDDTDDSQRYRDYNYHNEDDEKQNDKKEQKKDDEEDEEENVDLYEKFVRERFGKKGSFEQRSEKLKDATHISENPALFATVKKILEKTKDTQKEAEKSGDPNAAYMWTLEYGENL